MLTFFRNFHYDYQAARWMAFSYGSPYKLFGTRNSILSAFWFACREALRSFRKEPDRSAAIAAEEKMWMEAELPPRLVVGRRLITDSIKVEGDSNGNTV